MMKKQAAATSINEQEKHVAEFCFSLLQIINERHREETQKKKKRGKGKREIKRKKTTMTTNAYKDGHSQIL